jgi:hypothetical protein
VALFLLLTTQNMGLTRILTLTGVLLAGTAAAGTVAQFGGTYNYWPTVWTSLIALNDPSGDISRNSSDFYSGSGSTAYYAQDSGYLYFRARINYTGAISAGTLSDSYFIFVDRQNWSSGGTSDGFPDFGFVWDAKSNNNNNHGLEMAVHNTGLGANLWSDLRMADVDGLSGQKGTQDFAGTGGTQRIGDGYVRTIDGAAGGGAFIDFAISWSYLTNYSTTGLAPFQTWSIALGSIQNANDHNAVDGDIAGGSGPGSLINTGWSDPIYVVPEPATGWLAGMGLLAAFARLRHRRSAV